MARDQDIDSWLLLIVLCLHEFISTDTAPGFWLFQTESIADSENANRVQLIVTPMLFVKGKVQNRQPIQYRDQVIVDRKGLKRVGSSPRLVTDNLFLQQWTPVTTEAEKVIISSWRVTAAAALAARCSILNWWIAVIWSTPKEACQALWQAR